MLVAGGNEGQSLLARLRGNGSNVSMVRRLFLFFVALIAVLLVITLTILFLTGIVISPGGNARRDISRELTKTADALTRRFGETAAHASVLSVVLAESIEASLAASGLAFNQLSGRRDALDAVADRAAARLLAALDKTSCTGVFMTLDATVNPSLPLSRYSRAGLYIRNVEPSGSARIALRTALRGSTDIIFRYRMEMMTLWDLEFQVGDRLFYNEPIKGYLANPRLPLSRLYYWTSQSPLPGLYDKVMVCSIPIIGKNGEVYGVCGFEISNPNFRFLNSPDISLFPRVAALIAPLDETGLYPENALIAGSLTIKADLLKTGSGGRGLSVYSGGGISYAGLHRALKLYSADSPFTGEQGLPAETLAAAVLIPMADLNELIFFRHFRIVIAFIVLFALSAALALYLSRRFVRPITKSLDALGRGKHKETRLHEIDMLLGKITAARTSSDPLLKSAAAAADNGSAATLRMENLFADFVERCKTLTPAERQIFDYHVRGLSTKEILAEKTMSMPTLKSHNTHIYAKLEISTREELLLYIELIRKSGLLHIFEEK
jgi:DNA-binding CsgD family transcriptional regulator